MEFAKEQVRDGLFGVNRICHLTGISKKTYYHNQHPHTRLDAKYQEIKERLRLIITRHPKYGVKRIKADLARKYQLVIGRDTLAKLLDLWGLSLARQKHKQAISSITKLLCYVAGRANLLIRTKITHPLQAITSDITELTYNHGKDKLYLNTHKDVYGQMIYGFALGTTMELSLVMHSLKQAGETITTLAGSDALIGLLFHQDRGSQYTSYAYVDQVLKLSAKLSYSDPGTPTHNGGQESFHGRLKDEYRDDIYELETEAEVRQFVTHIINDYNQERLHTSIGCVPPFEYTKKFLNQPHRRYTKLRD